MESKIDNNINIEPLLNEIDEVIKKGLNNIFNLFYHLLNIAFIMSVVVVVHSLMNYI